MCKPNIILQLQPQAVQQLLAQLVAKFSPLQIYCFGRASLGGQTAGSFLQHSAHYHQQYFLFMLTVGNRRIEHTVQDYANTHFTRGKVTIIAHGLAHLQKALAKGNRFFNKVVAPHNLWYSRTGFMLPLVLRPPAPLAVLKKANRQYRHHIPLAKGFLHSAKTSLQRGSYGLSVFLLHQAVAQACMALIGVHLGYRADLYHLGRLLQLCNCFSALPAASFLGSNDQEQQLFALLVQSYGQLRYKRSYKVGQNATGQLYYKVAGFVALATQLCQQEIATLKANCNIQGEGRP